MISNTNMMKIEARAWNRVWNNKVTLGDLRDVEADCDEGPDEGGGGQNPATSDVYRSMIAAAASSASTNPLHPPG